MSNFVWTLDHSQLMSALRESSDELESTGAAVDDLGAKMDETMSQSSDSAEDAGDSVKDLGDETKDAGSKGEAAGKAFSLSMKHIAAAAAVAAAAIAKVVHEAIEFSDTTNQMMKRAREVGASAEEFQRVQGVLDLMTRGGIDAALALTKLNKNIDEARGGTGPAAEAFERLRINVEDFAKLDASEQLAAIADGMVNVEDKAARTNVSMDLLGLAGKALGPAFEAGSDAIRANAAAMDDAGLISEDTAVKSEALQDALHLLNVAFEKLKADVLTPLIPVLTDVVNLFGRIFSSGDKSERALDKLNRRLGKTDEGFSDIVPKVDEFSDAVETATERTTDLKDAAKAMSDQVAASFGILSHEKLVAAMSEIGEAPERFKLLEEQLVRMTRPSEAAAEDMAASFKAMEDGIVDAALAGVNSVEKWRQLQEALGVTSPVEARDAIRLYAETLVVEYERAWEDAGKVVKESVDEQKDTLDEAADEAARAAEEQKRTQMDLAAALASYAEQATDVWFRVADTHLEASERIRVEAMREANAIRDALEEQLDAHEYNLEERHALQAAADELLVALRAETLQQLDEMQAESAARRVQMEQDAVLAMVSIGEGFAGSMSRLGDIIVRDKMKHGQEMTEEEKRQALDAFYIAQAAALAQAAVSTALAVINAIANTPGPVWVQIAAGVAAGIAGGVAIAAIAAEQPPSFHSGGTLHDEVTATLLESESVLSRTGTAAAGGEEGVRRLNRGDGMMGGPIVVVSKVNNRTTNVQVHEVLRTRSGPLWEALRASQSRVGNHVPSFARM